MTLVISAPLPHHPAEPSRLIALWHRIVGPAPAPEPVDDGLLLELERLAEISPRLLIDLDFVQDPGGVFEPQVWRRGDVTVRVDADGSATASQDG